MTDQAKQIDSSRPAPIGDAAAAVAVPTQPDAADKFRQQYVDHDRVGLSGSPGLDARGQVMGIHPDAKIAIMGYYDPDRLTWSPERLKEFLKVDPPPYRHFPLETEPDAPKLVTQIKVEEVRANLEKGVNDLIPEHEMAILKQLRDGALDSDSSAIQNAYMALKDDPKKLQAMVKELNHEFSGLDSSVRFSVLDGNRLVLTTDNKNGVVFSDKSTSAARVTKGADGYEYISQNQEGVRPVAEVMQDVRHDLCSPPLSTIYIKPLPEHFPRHHIFDPLKYYDENDQVHGHLDIPKLLTDKP